DALRCGARPEVTLRYFEFWTGRLHGIFPDFESCDICRNAFAESGARVSIADGTAMCSKCSRAFGGRSLPISRRALGVVDAFRRLNPSALVNVAIPGPALAEVGEAAAAALVAFADH